MNSFNRITKYLQYRLNAKTKHAVHSPFLFELITQVLNNKQSNSDYTIVENYKKTLLKDKTIISCPDLGAASKVLKSNQNSIQQIAKSSSVNKKFGRLLYRLVEHFRPNTILELGTSLGISTQYLALANKNAKVITLEGCSDKTNYNKQFLKNERFKNIDSHTGNFDILLPEVLTKTTTVDLVFFDGNHQEKATLNYFEHCLSKINNKTIFIFDDIYWSKGMENAWEKIIEHPKVTLSINLYYMGIVFFRKENTKEHFDIKF